MVKTLATQCLNLALIFSSHPQEVIGTVLNGFLVTRFLNVKKDQTISQGKEILQEAVEICTQAERDYHDRINVFEDDLIDKSKNAFSQTLEGLISQLEKPEKEALQWIVDNASAYTKCEIRHASQGFVLTLVPLALYWMLNQKNNFLLETILKQGRETEKLGALAGAWRGADYGRQGIPKN